MFNYVELPNCFLKWLYDFIFPLTKYKGFNLLIPSWIFAIVHFFFLMTAILVGMKWYLTADLLCTSLMTNVTEYLLMFLLAICISSFKKCLLKSFVYFSMGLLFFLLLSRKILCIFWIQDIYQIYDLKIFSHIQWAVFLLTWRYNLQHNCF